MDALEAAVSVLDQAGEPLHWTVIQDRALRLGLIDPFVVTDVRARLLTALRDGVHSGSLVRVGKGVYAVKDPAPGSAKA